MYLYLIFGLYLKCMYLQIQSNTYKNYQQKVKHALPEINWLRSQDGMFSTPGQVWASSAEKIDWSNISINE